ncbi:MAG: GIY-YIG nuclease family protein [Parcubacteria group bacterium]|jgi:putative endonuclease
MYYVYVLKLQKCGDKEFYIGYTADLRKRLAQHCAGQNNTTKNKKPELIYYEAFENEQLARNREKGLKTSGSVYMSLMKRLGLK